MESEPARSTGPFKVPIDDDKVEVIGVTHNRQAAYGELAAHRPDVLLVDLMMADTQSLDIVRRAEREYPNVRVLAHAPTDLPHDRIILALSAGALGFICRDAQPAEYVTAIERVNMGEP